MKKLLVLTFALLATQLTYASSDLRLGLYEGSTAAGETCRVDIDAKRVSVSYHPTDRPWNAFSVSRSNANESLSDGVYSASGSDSAVAMNLKANVANDGTLVNATFRMGILISQLGHKVDCAHMQLKAQSFDPRF